MLDASMVDQFVLAYGFAAQVLQGTKVQFVVLLVDL